VEGNPQDRLPAFGRLPWFALLRRARSFRFFVFFDMRRTKVVDRASVP
jgi:hypothetical protein